MILRDEVPLPGATVVLWEAEREVGRVITASNGRFVFAPGVAARASALTVRRLGFTPRVLTVQPGDDGLRIRLVPLAQPLPTQVVQARKQRRCPIREQPADRAFWDQIRGTYWQAPRHVGIATLRTVTSADVDVGKVGEFTDDTAVASFHGVTGMARRDFFATLARDGMATKLPKPRAGQALLDPAFLHWAYPTLHQTMGEYFLTNDFARDHAFRRTTAPDSSVTIEFCPRTRKRPGAEGRLEVGADGSVSHIQWSFVTPKPREDAGGELWLVPSTVVSARRFVPARSVYWRRLSGRSDRYYQETWHFRGWYWGETADIPYEAAGR